MYIDKYLCTRICVISHEDGDEDCDDDCDDESDDDGDNDTDDDGTLFRLPYGCILINQHPSDNW